MDNKANAQYTVGWNNQLVHSQTSTAPLEFEHGEVIPFHT